MRSNINHVVAPVMAHISKPFVCNHATIGWNNKGYKWKVTCLSHSFQKNTIDNSTNFETVVAGPVGLVNFASLEIVFSRLKTMSYQEEYSAYWVIHHRAKLKLIYMFCETTQVIAEG
mgnify:CR=1 FL=1